MQFLDVVVTRESQLVMLGTRLVDMLVHHVVRLRNGGHVDEGRCDVDAGSEPQKQSHQEEGGCCWVGVTMTH